MAPKATPLKLVATTLGGELFKKFTMANLAQLLNACASILVTPLPIVTLLRPVQEKNALVPIVVTVLGMVTLVRLVQLENVPGAILVKPLPISTLVRPEH